MFSGTVKAVDDISMDIKSNEIVGLIGESGCGKSTVGFSILRLVPTPGEIVGGKIALNGINLLDLSKEEIRNKYGRSPFDCDKGEYPVYPNKRPSGWDGVREYN